MGARQPGDPQTARAVLRQLPIASSGNRENEALGGGDHGSTLPMIKAGIDPNLGIDKYFLDKAAQDGSKKTVVEIESAEWQMNLLSGLLRRIAGEAFDVVP